MLLHAHNESEMEALGLALGRVLRPGDVVALCGDLGTGKTTLTKAMGHALEVPGYMTSPSYNIVNMYPCLHGTLYHADVYRVDDVSALDDIGFFDYLHDGSLVVIEWADKIYDDLVGETDQLIRINLNYAPVGRQIEMAGYPDFEARLKELGYETAGY